MRPLGRPRQLAGPAVRLAVTSCLEDLGPAVEAVQHLRQDGNGGAPEGDGQKSFLPGGGASIRTASIYDANSRLIELIDDRGGTTLYTYDSLDRQTRVTFHDGSMRDTTYDAASDVTRYEDENRSQFAFTLDAAGRTTAVDITRATGVVGTTAQAVQYDGLSRQTFTRDTSDSANADASFAFDSLGRVVEEAQAFGGNTRYLTHNAFESAPPSRFTYANAREIGYNYDDLYRRTQTQDEPDSAPADIAQWWFFGPGRVAEVKLGNALYQTHMNNARTRSAVQEGVAAIAWGTQSSDRLGYDGAGRMVAKRFLDATADDSGYSDTTALVGFTTQFDMGSNKVYERALHAASRSHLYPSQDSLGRLLQYQRGTLAQADDGSVSVASPITLPSTDADRSYDLDGLGNWKNTVFTPANGSETIENRRHNLLNQITRMGTTTVLYDHGNNAADPDPLVAARGSGNIVNDGSRKYVYDAFNRLKEVYKASGGVFNVQIAAYVYDALGRRIRKTVTNSGLTGDIPNGTTDCLYRGIQCAEERNPFGGGGSTDTPIRQYVWGIYVDEMVQQKDLGTPDVDYYPLSDLLYRTAVLTNASKSIAEAYDYDAYGNTLIFSAAGSGGNWFADNATTTDSPKCRYLFTGREYDSETGIYWYRARYYLPQLGRFQSRDFVVVELDGYRYVLSSPSRLSDPYGLWGKETHYWAVEDYMSRRCPAISKPVACASWALDLPCHGAPEIVLAGIFSLGLNTLRPEVQEDYNYHFPGAGAPFPWMQTPVLKGWNNKIVTDLFNRVINPKDQKGCDPVEFGKFLHMLADSFSHGGDTPQVFGHAEGVPMFGLIDAKGREIPAWWDKDGRMHIDTERVVVDESTGEWKGKWESSPGVLSARVDNPARNWKSWNQALDAMALAMDAFKAACPRACRGEGKDQ